MNVCEFCNAYIANFEVHRCRKFGNQHRQSSATLPRSISDIRAPNIDSVSAQQTDSEAQWPFHNQSNSSTQQSFLPDVHQRIECGETAAAETFPHFEYTLQNQYNPDISAILFPEIPHGPENLSKSTHLQQLFEVNKVSINQNLQCGENSNQNYLVNAPLPVSEPCFLPGFQQTFGQRNAQKNQIAQLPNATSQMEGSRINRMDEMPSYFISDLNEGDNTSMKRISHYYETSSGIPISALQSTQYNPIAPIPPTDSIAPIHSNKCPKEFLPKDHLEPHDSSCDVARPYSCNYCDRTFSYNGSLKRHIRNHT
ncbi:hypothetical protein CDAR_214131, partial [Caerostris darwini]